MPSPKALIVISMTAAGVVLLAEAHRRTRRIGSKRSKLLPICQPPPPALEQPLPGLTSALKDTPDVEGFDLPHMEGLDALVEKKRTSTDIVNPETNGRAPPEATPSSQWFAWKSGGKARATQNVVTSIADGLKRLYVEKLKPLEVAYQFEAFVSPLLTDGDFDAKPMVMLLGQYSTGKTTFIRHLLGGEYPGAHIGPEPTTDKFVAVMSGPDKRSIPGNTAAVHADKPFNGLMTFGGAFLS